MPWVSIEQGDGYVSVWEPDPPPAGMVWENYDNGGEGRDWRLVPDVARFTQMRSAQGGAVLEILNDAGQWERGVYSIEFPDKRMPESVARALGIRYRVAPGHVAGHGNLLSELAADPNFVQFALTVAGSVYASGAIGAGTEVAAAGAESAFAADVAASAAADELFISQVVTAAEAQAAVTASAGSSGFFETIKEAVAEVFQSIVQPAPAPVPDAFAADVVASGAADELFAAQVVTTAEIETAISAAASATNAAADSLSFVGGGESSYVAEFAAGGAESAGLVGGAEVSAGAIGSGFAGPGAAEVNSVLGLGSGSVAAGAGYIAPSGVVDVVKGAVSNVVKAAAASVASALSGSAQAVPVRPGVPAGDNSFLYVAGAALALFALMARA